MVLLNSPYKILCLLLACLGNVSIAQSGFFMPFDTREILTVKVDYGDQATYHNVQVLLIDTEVPGEITCLFQDECRYDPNFIASAPLIGAHFFILHHRRCVNYPDFMTILGRSVRIFSDSTWIFTLYDGKTFSILTNAEVGETWDVYPLLNGSKIKGTMLSIEPGEEPDEWIKTIELTTEEKPDLPSGKFDFYPIIRISTTKGLLEMPRLSGFGKAGDGIIHNSRPVKFQFKDEESSSNPQWDRFRFKNIWNLKIGDIIVSEKIDNLNKSIEHLEVLDTQWSLDSSTVNFKWIIKTFQILDENQAELSSTRVVDTTIVKNDFWVRMDTLLPFTVFPHSVSNMPLVDAILTKSDLNYYNGRQYYHRYQGGVWKESKRCFEYFGILEDSQSMTEYIEGLGGPYRYFEGFPFLRFLRNIHYVIYYKKGDEEWGDQGVLTSMQNLAIPNNELRIFPTLASSGSEIQIANIAQEAQISVMNLQGILMPFTERISEGGRAIHLADFKPGLYLVRVSSQKGEYSSGKFIVH